MIKIVIHGISLRKFIRLFSNTYCTGHTCKLTGEEMEGIRGKMGWMGDDWKREMG